MRFLQISGPPVVKGLSPGGLYVGLIMRAERENWRGYRSWVEYIDIFYLHSYHHTGAFHSFVHSFILYTLNWPKGLQFSFSKSLVVYTIQLFDFFFYTLDLTHARTMKSFAFASVIAATVAAPLVGIPSNITIRVGGGSNVAPFGDKKGIAFHSYASQAAATMAGPNSATWAYNWSTVWNALSFNYIPMLVGSFTKRMPQLLTRGRKELLSLVIQSEMDRTLQESGML